MAKNRKILSEKEFFFSKLNQKSKFALSLAIRVLFSSPVLFLEAAEVSILKEVLCLLPVPIRGSTVNINEPNK